MNEIRTLDRIALPGSYCPKCTKHFFECQCSLVPEAFVPGTVKPEWMYATHNELSRKLSLPCPQAHIKLESVGPEGDLVDLYADRSRTLNRNYWNYLFKMMATSNPATTGLTTDTTFSAGHLTNKLTNATVQNANVGLSALGSLLGSAGSNAQGIVVGTGVAAESFEDAALGTIVANGTGSGQMSYNASTQNQPTYNAGTLTWTQTLVRIINNNSSGTIVIGEVGVYAQITGGGNTVMLMRDKLGATVSVLAAGQLTVTYTFTLTFPA